VVQCLASKGPPAEQRSVYGIDAYYLGPLSAAFMESIDGDVPCTQAAAAVKSM
jgi:hypothetical protein